MGVSSCKIIGLRTINSLSDKASIFTVLVVIFRVVGPTESCAETEIGELDVTGSIDENIVWLDVSVDEAHRMDTLDGADKFGNVEPEKD